MDFDELLDAYDQLHPTEIILPDTLKDSGDTIEKGRTFLAKMEQHGIGRKDCKRMFVPQGKDLDEWIACLTIALQDD